MWCSQRLGGKLGKAVQEDLGVKTPGDLLPFSQLKLQELYGVNTGYNSLSFMAANLSLSLSDDSKLYVVAGLGCGTRLVVKTVTRFKAVFLLKAIAAVERFQVQKHSRA